MDEFFSALAKKLNAEIFVGLVAHYSNSPLHKAKLETRTWERYCNHTPETIGQLIGQAEMGDKLFDFIKKVPKLNLAAKIKPITKDVLEVELDIVADFEWDQKVHGNEEVFSVVVKDNTGRSDLHCEEFRLKMQYVDEPHTLNFSFQIFEHIPTLHVILVTSEKWLGSLTALPILFDRPNLILPTEQSFPPPTLLDIQTSEGVAYLVKPSYQVLYDFTHFNAVQKTVFPILYKTDHNVLVAAANGNGKGVCAEFAILREYEKKSKMRVVYIAPFKSLAKRRYCDWEKKFATGLGLRVVELKGKLERDLKLLEEGHIIISTPENWDALSRFWQSRSGYYVRQVSLFIIDDLQLVGSPRGAVLEIIVSRMRYISSRAQIKIRFVALATPLAYVVDISKWIGISPHGLFNFPPGFRPVPVELHIQEVDLYDFEDAMQAMTKLTFGAICPHAKYGIPAIVFVPTHTHVCLTAVDLVTFASACNKERSIFLPDFLDLQSCTSKIQDSTLKFTLRCGVGFLHEGLSTSDINIVLCLFKARDIKVCVLTSSMCWEVSLSAHLVVVMGTRYYDPREKSHINYPVTDLLQMVGHAGRFMLDKSSTCVVFTDASRKQHYKKFLFEALPVESSLLNCILCDTLNSDIAVGIVNTIEGAMNFLSWTYFSKRLSTNPNYYYSNKLSVFQRTNFISNLVEYTLCRLYDSNFILVGSEDRSLSSLNYGLISTVNYVSCLTIQSFVDNLKSTSRWRSILKNLSDATEFSRLPVRFGEKDLLRKLNNDHDENADFTCSHVKVDVLLQAHLSRLEIDGLLLADLHEVLITATRLLQAMVDVLSSHGWLYPALWAMELSQMVTQGLWENDSILLQLPHFTRDLAKRCQENPGRPIETVYDLLEMEDNERSFLLHMSESQLWDVACFCNRFPDIDITYEVVDDGNIQCGGYIRLFVTLQRHISDGVEVGPVIALRYPAEKEEGWWLVVGSTESNQLLAYEKIMLQREMKIELNFVAPIDAGKKTYTLSFMSDSYRGCDQEYTFTVDIK